MNLTYKPATFNHKPCVIEKVVVLSGAEFDSLVTRPHENRGFIAENRDLMWEDAGSYHCLMALGEGRGDAVLIEAEGSNYARKAAFLPGGRIILEHGIERAADYIIQTAAPEPETLSWEIGYGSLKDATGLVVKEDNGIGAMLLEALQQRPELDDVELREDGFLLVCSSEFYNTLTGEKVVTGPGASRVGTPDTEATEALRDRIRENYLSFEAEWMKAGSAWLVANAEEIAATKQAYSDIFAYASEGHMEYLLRFANPLEVVRDAYMNGLNFTHEADICCTIDFLMEKRRAETEYELDDAFTGQTQSGGMEMGGL
jgi:hypothetical protein